MIPVARPIEDVIADLRKLLVRKMMHEIFRRAQVIKD